MCGIIAYTGKKQARDFLIDGLKTLEYRGYDSAGIFVSGWGRTRTVGKVSNLESKIPKEIRGSTGIAHTRWATHGIPSQVNAHPHSDEKGTVYVVHNGIIENYLELKKELVSRGHIFSSETDTEVIAHLFEEVLSKEKNPQKAFAKTLSFLRGTYGIVLVSNILPDTLFVARMGSPVVIGIASHGTIVASDASAIVRHTRNAIFLSDGEMCVITPTEYEICSFNQKPVEKKRNPLARFRNIR